MSRIVPTLIFLVLICGLTACAPPTTTPATGDLAGATPPPPPAPPSAPPPPPMSTPTPPRVKPQPVAVDSSCKTSADCAVKDVGNCCGTMPACVNKDSPTDPAAVKAECEAKGMSGICGFREISSCQCVSGQCEATDASAPQVQ